MSASGNQLDNKTARSHGNSPRQQWLIVVGLALLSLVLGTVGFLRAKYPSGETMGTLDAIYNSMQLFHMHMDSVSRPLARELQVARFLAPLVLGVTLVKGFIYAAPRTYL